MSLLPAALDTALAADRPLVFAALEINFNTGANLRLLDGAGALNLPTGAFTGSDPTFGIWAAVDPPSDGTGDEAPAMGFTLAPPSDASAALLSAATMQGSRVRLSIGAVGADGNPVSDPYLLFDGELDVPKLAIDRGERTVEYECVSALERLFSDDEGIRLSSPWHESVWPGEYGLRNVTGVTKTIWWGPGMKPQTTGGNIGGGAGPGGGGTYQASPRMNYF